MDSMDRAHQPLIEAEKPMTDNQQPEKQRNSDDIKAAQDWWLSLSDGEMCDLIIAAHKEHKEKRAALGFKW